MIIDSGPFVHRVRVAHRRRTEYTAEVRSMYTGQSGSSAGLLAIVFGGELCRQWRGVYQGGQTTLFHLSSIVSFQELDFSCGSVHRVIRPVDREPSHVKDHDVDSSKSQNHRLVCPCVTELKPQTTSVCPGDDALRCRQQTFPRVDRWRWSADFCRTWMVASIHSPLAALLITSPALQQQQ